MFREVLKTERETASKAFPFFIWNLKGDWDSFFVIQVLTVVSYIPTIYDWRCEEIPAFQNNKNIFDLPKKKKRN